MGTFRRLAASFMTLWASLKLWQRASLILTSILILGAIAAMVFAAGQTSYDPLFAGLEVEDQAAIVEYLRENNIPYQLDPSSNAILLPRSSVYETRLSLAQEGLPRGGHVGYEIFDNSKMGMSEFQQKIAYIRAIEGELARTITKMDSVESARVSVAVPEQRLFLEQRQPSSASVLLRLRSGASLGALNVKSIIHLVSHSIDGLDPDNVTVVDTSGRILSDMVSDSMFIYPDGNNPVTSVQRELEKQKERELETKVRAMLEQVFGPGSAVVRVNVELDFDKRTRSHVEYTPNPETGQGVPRSNERGEETYTGQGQPVADNPGTTTNIPGYAINTQNVNSDYSKSNATINYEITTTKSEQVVTPGGIRRLSASVLVDGALEEDALSELRDVISSAIGYSEQRGDSLVVKSMKFSTAFADAMAAEMRQERMWRIISGSFVALVMLALMALAVFWWLKKKRLKMQAAVDAEEASKKVPTIQEMLASPDLLAFQGELAVIEEQIKAYARNNPGEVANLVNEWLAADD